MSIAVINANQQRYITIKLEDASMKDIRRIDSVQRKFTKRIPGMSELTYSRLKVLCLKSLL